MVSQSATEVAGSQPTFSLDAAADWTGNDQVAVARQILVEHEVVGERAPQPGMGQHERPAAPAGNGLSPGQHRLGEHLLLLAALDGVEQVQLASGGLDTEHLSNVSLQQVRKPAIARAETGHLHLQVILDPDGGPATRRRRIPEVDQDGTVPRLQQRVPVRSGAIVKDRLPEPDGPFPRQ